jgi:hypothetical protein
MESLLDFITAVTSVGRLDRWHVEAVFGEKLRELGGTTYHCDFELDTFPIAEGLSAEAIALRAAKAGSGATSALLTMQIVGGCLSLAEVKARYPAMFLVGAPRGRSLDERSIFETNVHGMAVRFGFDQSVPSCMRSLTFEASVPLVRTGDNVA